MNVRSYVESRIQASLDSVWDATQQPGQHQGWDVRFGSIRCLPRVNGEPQRYSKRRDTIVDHLDTNQHLAVDLGSFAVEERPCPAAAIPADVLPVREELRDWFDR